MARGVRGYPSGEISCSSQHQQVTYKKEDMRASVFFKRWDGGGNGSMTLRSVLPIQHLNILASAKSASSDLYN